MAQTPTSQISFAAVVDVGSSTTATKTVGFSFTKPSTVSGTPMLFFQAISPDASTEIFATRLISVVTAGSVVSVAVLVTEVRPVGSVGISGAGWNFNLQLNMMISYPALEVMPFVSEEMTEWGKA